MQPDGASAGSTARSTVVVDDAEHYRALVRAVLSGSGGFAVVGEGGSGQDAVRLAERHRPQLMLLDLSMPGMDGLEALPRVRRASPQTRVVVLSGFAPEGGPAEAALAAGAVGYIDKEGLIVELPARLKALLDRDQPRALAPRAGAEPSPLAQPPSEPLGERQAGDEPGQLEAAEHAERFREFFETAAIGMALLTLTGRVVRANARLCELAGQDRRALVGEPYPQLAHRDDAAPLARQLDTLIRGRARRAELEHRLARRPDGDVWVLTTAAAVADSSGAPLYLFVQAQDISARKRAEARLELQAAIAETMREGVILVRANDNRILYTNRAFDDMFGYQPGELAGRDALTLNAPAHQPGEQTAAAIIDQSARSRGGWSGTVHNHRADGSEFWSQASGSSFEHPQHGPLWIGVHTDLGERPPD